MDLSDRKWVLGSLGLVVLVAVAPLLLGLLHLANGSAGELAAVLAFVGVLVTAAVSIIGFTLTRQSDRRLRLEARMKTGG